MRPVRASADRVQLVPQSPLPQVPGRRRRGMDGGPASRTAARRLLPRGLHAPGGAGTDRAAEPEGGLRPAVPRRRRDLAADRRRPEAPRGRDRLPGRAPHLGPEPPAPPPRPLRRAGGRARPRRLALGRVPVAASSCRCACSAASSGGSSSRCSKPPSIRASSPSTGSSPRWPTRASSGAGSPQSPGPSGSSTPSPRSAGRNRC